VVELPTDDLAAAPAPTTSGEHMVSLERVSRISQVPQGTSQPGSSHMRLGSGKPLSRNGMACLLPGVEPNSSPIQRVKHVEPVSFYPCILPPQLIPR